MGTFVLVTLLATVVQVSEECTASTRVASAMSEDNTPLRSLAEAELDLQRCFSTLTDASDQHRPAEALEQSLVHLKAVHAYFVSVQQEETTASTAQDEIADSQLDIQQKDALLEANSAKMHEWLELFTELAATDVHQLDEPSQTQ